ncbi:AAA family ATPase [Mycobacterium marinum]|uniref:AAA family ATPase n=1 Tax=Mycobacterium marinum TaxID=1781 RepID=UPI00356683D6
MIRELRLIDWRAYKALTLTLEPGTTFIVASNGIGKTSLIEGASWALYGDAGGRPTDVVRKGAKSASATVELVLPDRRVLTMTRDMPAKLAKSASVPVKALLGGVPISAQEADALIVESLGEPSFLARLTMLRSLSSGHADPSSLNLNHNLSRVFGIDGLQRALSALDERRRVLTREIKEARDTSPPSPAELMRRSAEVARTSEDVERLTAAHDEAIRLEREAESELRTVDAYSTWSAGQAERTRQLTELATQGVKAEILAQFTTAHESGDKDLALSLRTHWETAERNISSSLEDMRVRAGVLQARIDAIRLSLAELDTASGQCPVCRRPLEPDDERAARVEHEQDLASLEEEASKIDTASAADALSRTKSWLRALSPLAHRTEPPPRSTLDRHTALTGVASASSSRAAAFELLVTARTAASAARTAFEEASADDADTQRLAQLYEQEATVNAAVKAMAAVVDGLMKQTVGPLADELANRWKLLFADRGPVRLESGALSREINGLNLPYSAFSDGEKASSQLLLRLLVLDAATQADFCWIDEPLEHLDPATRRHVGSMLARAATTSGARQILVTTYEEPLARRLALRYPDNTRVIYVRPGDADAT